MFLRHERLSFAGHPVENCAMNTSAIIFDGDDTLWDTMPLYAAAKDRFYARMGDLGFDRQQVPKVFEETDLLNLRTHGFARSRFPTSMIDTYTHFCTSHGQAPSESVQEELWNIGDAVFSSTPPTLPGAEEVLRHLAHRYKLYLMTKGDPEVQHQRVEASGLRHFFDRVFIVPHKGTEDFARVVADLHLDPRQVWSVGNSLKSDINPALAAGLSAVWIPYHTWDAEVDQIVDSPRLFEVNDLPACLEVLVQQGA